MKTKCFYCNNVINWNYVKKAPYCPFCGYGNVKEIEKYYKAHPNERNKKIPGKRKYWFNFLISNLHWVAFLLFIFLITYFGTNTFLQYFKANKEDAQTVGIIVSVASTVIIFNLIQKTKNFR